MICEYCANLRPIELQDPRFPVGARFPKRIAIGNLKTSSCDECQLIWRALEHHSSDCDAEEVVEVLISRNQPLRIKYPRYKDRPVTLDVFTRQSRDTAMDDSGPCIGSTREVSESSGSDECFAAAESWLKECRQSHSTCQIPGEVALPTRVVDVGRGGVREPFLVERPDASAGPYIALSYCWGHWKDHPPMKTVKRDVSDLNLKANYEDFKRAIKFSEMPKTIQDAVTITRRLGIQYLWVDALCIVQHDPEEWLIESGKMCEVYSNAILTISATQASGSSMGIFNRQRFGIQTTSLGSLSDGRAVYVRPNLGKHHNDCDWGLLSRIPAIPDSLRTEPLAARAWCMQESVLSNRILHYTSDELMWECNETQRCECGFGSGTADPNENPNILLRRPDVVLGNEHNMNFFWRNMWSNYIHIFSRRGITDGRDKLPALSGLAKKFSDALACRMGREPTYLAGLWGEELLMRCLCWYVSPSPLGWFSDDTKINGVYRPRRPDVWRAPSWSFMSLDAPISPLDAFVFESAVEVREASTEPLNRSADPFGQVVSGKIVLYGQLIRDLGCDYTGTNFHLDDGMVGKDYITFSLFDNAGNSLPFHCDVPSQIPQGRSFGFFLLLLGYKVIGFSMKEPCFLVLREASGRQANRYERIGLASERDLPQHEYVERRWDSKWAENAQVDTTELTII